MDKDQPRPKARRGFAAMSPEKRREIARKRDAAKHPGGGGGEPDTNEPDT